MNCLAYELLYFCARVLSDGAAAAAALAVSSAMRQPPRPAAATV
jgi:hypothetical protein